MGTKIVGLSLQEMDVHTMVGDIFNNDESLVWYFHIFYENIFHTLVKSKIDGRQLAFEFLSFILLTRCHVQFFNIIVCMNNVICIVLECATRDLWSKIPLLKVCSVGSMLNNVKLQTTMIKPMAFIKNYKKKKVLRFMDLRNLKNMIKIKIAIQLILRKVFQITILRRYGFSFLYPI